MPLKTFTTDSSLITKVSHDEENNQLHVYFRSDRSHYVYDNVDTVVYEAFSEAPSHGQHFLRHIKPKYVGVRQ